MRVTRVLDIMLLFVLAALLVIPRPSVTVKPALPLVAERHAHVAELQAYLLGHPSDVDASLELAHLFLDGHRPDWALATIGHVLPEHQDDYRLHLTRAIAFADRFEAPPAYDEVSRAAELCEREVPGVPACGEAPRARIDLLKTTLARIKNLDMRENLALARDRIVEGLHNVWVNKPAPNAAPKTAPQAAPKTAPGNPPASGGSGP